MTARYIAIDWGSTNLRAWLYPVSYTHLTLPTT